MNEKTILSLSGDEIELILSALRSDRVGTWGDGREERINSLMAKIKRVKPIKKITGFTKA
jgi:hypothetical protein